MLDKLLNNGKPLREIRQPLHLAIAIVFLSTNPLGASSKEYVFTAPPEVNRRIVKTPSSKTDYPLYECRSEAMVKPEKATEATEVNHALDIHDCNDQDSEDKLEESELAPTEQP
ncbi:MAG: hypothetical protein ACRC1Z_22595 [Waterburya sp.]